MDCLFCKIGSGEIDSHTVYEDDNAKAFLDINPLSLGHSVIVPKVHAENILELSNDDIGPLFSALKRVTKLLEDKLHPDGFNIGINQGEVSGQSVEHLHIHVIPRYKGDGGGSLHSIVKHPPEEDLQETHKKITT